MSLDGRGRERRPEDFLPRASSRGPASPGAGASVPAITVAPREVLLGPVLRPPEKQKERLSGSK